MHEQHITNSELTFLTCFIWRNAYNYQYAITDDCLIIRSKWKECVPTMRFPVGKGDKAAAFNKILKYAAERNEPLRFYSITEDMVEELKAMYKGEITVTDLREYYDYLYNVTDLIELTGKKYHSKRNHLNSFISGNYNYSRVTTADAPAILAAYDNWTLKRENGDNYFLQVERESIGVMLENISSFDFTACKLTHNGELCAFAIGEPINDDTVVIHIEKADVNVKGAYPAVNQLFLANEWSNFKYVNREDDSGIEGLRKAKLSYHPCEFVKKYEVRII